MAVFVYVVRIDGTQVRGEIESASFGQAEAMLREQNWAIVSLAEKRGWLQSFGAGRHAPMSAVLDFTEQLSTLLDAGLALDRALKVLMQTLPNSTIRDTAKDILTRVERGSSLTDAFAQHPRVFPRLYINMVRAGEEGGVLPVTLRRLVEFYERSIEFRAFLISSSIYPATLLVFGLMAMVTLALFVIPKFAAVFENAGKAMPPAAAFLIDASNTVQQYGLVIIATLVVMSSAVWFYLQTPNGRQWRDTRLLQLPLLGDLMLKAHLSRSARTLGALLAAGVPIHKGLHLVAQLSDNGRINAALSGLERGLREGEGLAGPMSRDAFFPPLLVNLVTVGEETGDLASMLSKIAERYDSDVRKAAKRFIALFEPLTIITMGILIGAIVVSMLSAIFSINDIGP